MEDMVIDKQLYWKNRKNNKPGVPRQELKTKLVRESGVTVVFDEHGKPFPAPRRLRRVRIRDHDYTKPNYSKRISRDEPKFQGHQHKKYDRPPEYPPHLTNNQRMKLREIKRIEDREKAKSGAPANSK